MDYISLAIPFFFLLMAIEWLAATLLEKDVYRLNDAVSNLQTGILQQVLGVFSKVVVFGSYVVLWNFGRLIEMDPASWPVWIACFLVVDHQYYWFHRISHEVNLPWGAHIVHHSSEEYNLAVALRQGAFQPLFSWVFYLPLAILGFPPLVFLACSSLNTLYQFWIHTRLIGKLGFLELFLNTPSHHRVHHGCDEKYLDRNYAGTFIVWDRLYGTFQVEEEEPTYGVTKPLASWNPLWANLHYYADLIEMSRRAPNFGERLKVWWKGPAWKPEWAPEGPGRQRQFSPLTHGLAGRYDSKAPQGLTLYAIAQFVLLLGLTVGLLFLGQQIPLWGQVAVALAVLWTAISVGGLFDARTWVLRSEIGRLAALPLLALFLLPSPDKTTVALAAVAGALFFGLFAAWLLRYRTLLRIDEIAVTASGG